MNFSLKSDASSIKNSSKYGTKLFHIRNFHCGELFCSSNQMVKNSSKHGTKLYNLRNFYYLELFCFTGGTEIKVEPGWSEHSSKYVTIFFYLWNFHYESAFSEPIENAWLGAAHSYLPFAVHEKFHML